MIETLQILIDTLRAAGVPVSPAESIDAARALSQVDVTHREAARLALRATLAKTRADAVRFDRVFAALFAPQRETGRRRRRRATGASGAVGRGRPQPEPDQAPSPLPSKRPVSHPEAPRRARAGRLVIISRQHPDLKASAPAPGRGGAIRRPSPARAAQRRRPAPAAAPPHAPLRRQDLAARMPRDLEDRLAREVPRMIREIRLKASRRWRQARAGRPWLARVMRANLGTGGVPFLIPMRRRRPRRPQVLVLADVSWSVMRASTLFLRMALGFIQERGRARVSLFVDRSADATMQLAAWLRAPAAELTSLLEQIPGLDPRAASDYGRAFYQAAHARHGLRAAAGRGSILVVLGDARGNWTDPQAWAFEQIAQACRRVIWLNPEPAARWDTGDSALSEYLPWCDVVCEASDLDGLSRGIAEIVRSL